MRIPAVTGPYVGIGLGDVSDEVAKITDFVIRKWDRFDADLIPGNRTFTPQLQGAIAELQDIYRDQGKLTEPFIPGVVNLATKYALGYLRKDVLLPLHVSVEGHLSDMWVGPAAHIGAVLHGEGRAIHTPTYYDNRKLPFDNASGVRSLVDRFSRTEIKLDNGAVIRFPAGTPFTVGAFSQGAMVWVEFYRQQLAPGKPLNWRLKDLRAVISIGSPYRQKGLVADWVDNPPAPDRQGIMPASDLMTNTPWWWLELANDNDLYTDNESEGDVGLFKTAVALIVTKNKWSGGPAAMLARVIDLLQPTDDLIPIAMAIISAIGFGVNMRPHMEHDLGPAIQFCRERLATTG